MSLYMLIFAFSFIFSALLLYILKHKLPADFLAAGFYPRSNHAQPARQLGGLACIPACICAIIIAGYADIIPLTLSLSLTLAAILLWVTGYLDDKNELPVNVRFPLQILAAIIAVYALGSNFRLFPNLLPNWLEVALLCVALMGSTNVANFMDGLDWLTVTGIGIPLCISGLIAGLLLQDPTIATIALAMSGALAGFAIYNRHPASIFLGDSGSLPLGLITGVVFLLFAAQTGIIPALILPLYYILDAGSTIVLRLRKGENILQAHSSHAYQIAKRAGKSVHTVTSNIAALNILLGLITTAIIMQGSIMAQLIGLSLAVIATGLLILHFRKTA